MCQAPSRTYSSQQVGTKPSAIDVNTSKSKDFQHMSSLNSPSKGQLSRMTSLTNSPKKSSYSNTPISKIQSSKMSEGPDSVNMNDSKQISPDNTVQNISSFKMDTNRKMIV